MSEVTVPTGYKNTDVGIIPEDWEAIAIGEALTIKHGKDQKGVESVSGKYPIFGTGGQMGWATAFLYDKPSVLIGRKGSINKPRYITVPFWTVDTLFYSQVHNGYDEKFMFYKFCLIDWTIYNEASGVPSLNARTISNVKISVPKKQEQTAIANALSDVDNLIKSLERLISKKEAIKTATMQQLLTGKTRLPEFAISEDGSKKGFKQTDLGQIPEDWDYKALSEMTENKGLVRGPFGGALKKDSFVRKGFKVYEQRNAIYANTDIGKYYINKDKFNELQRFTVKPRDFIVSCSGTIGRIYQIPLNAPAGIINQALLKITLHINTDEQFFYQIFNSKEFQENITDSTQGGAMKNLIGMSEFKKSLMLMPSKPEQTAIATILSDMDTEIQALNIRLAKTQDMKQGMMQQLLTGRVRLPH
ncbi:restriction endonuclease subunit S [Psychrobacter sp.]|uniref:restriction endonuclease subunit S n=1 Tax=Psychrobacter sp. TaxID=56811 RepID=UPI003BAEA20E